jgi:hypothetical protein
MSEDGRARELRRRRRRRGMQETRREGNYHEYWRGVRTTPPETMAV